MAGSSGQSVNRQLRQKNKGLSKFPTYPQTRQYRGCSMHCCRGSEKRQTGFENGTDCLGLGVRNCICLEYMLAKVLKKLNFSGFAVPPFLQWPRCQNLQSTAGIVGRVPVSMQENHSPCSFITELALSVTWPSSCCEPFKKDYADSFEVGIACSTIYSTSPSRPPGAIDC